MDTATRRQPRGGSGIGLLLLGAGLMYLFDPASGRRRRARLRDQAIHAACRLRDAERVALVDTAHRIEGLIARAKHAVKGDEPADDPVLVGRVRAAMGRFASHPHAVKVSSNAGNVVLEGVILADELPALLRCVEHVPGVKSVENRLQAYPDADAIPALQGGRTRTGPQAEWRQRNWSPAARLVAGTTGAALLLSGLRRTGLRGVTLRIGGGALIARAAMNRRLNSIVGFGKCDGILVDNSIHIRAPVERVFEYWREFENFPQWMSHVIAVQPTGQGTYRWVVEGPAGLPVEWESGIVFLDENREMRWRSREGSVVSHRGRVRFDPEDTGTRVQVQLCYVPIGGVLGHAVAKAFGSDPKSEMDDDLMRLKTFIETGKPPHDAAARRQERAAAPLEGLN